MHIRQETPSAHWLDPSELDAEKFAMKKGRILLGKTKSGKLIGVDDNRHVVTIAGSRAGKSATSLLSNLMTWDGSMIAIDPKGELAANSAAHRAAMGQDVFIIDPFEEVKGEAAKYRQPFNPMSELGQGHELDRVDDAALLADAMILSDGRDDHWTQSGRNLVQSLILYLLISEGEDGNLIDLRDLLALPLSEPKEAIGPDEISLRTIFSAMGKSDAFGGVVANAGTSFNGKPATEAGSIISTASEQLAFLRSEWLEQSIRKSTFSLRDLKRKPTSIYLVLPASRMASHFRWLRVILMQAMAAMERTKNATGQPVLFILEEFPTLGYMRQIEAAAGLMAGYDVKLWTVMQDLSQIQAHYPKSWETFLGNAGVIEAFGNADSTTTEYLSRRLGMTLTIQRQKENLSLQAQAQGEARERETIVSVPLLAPYEITQAFNRDQQNKLVMMPEYAPFALSRVFWKDLPKRNKSDGFIPKSKEKEPPVSSSSYADLGTMNPVTDYKIVDDRIEPDHTKSLNNWFDRIEKENQKPLSNWFKYSDENKDG